MLVLSELHDSYLESSSKIPIEAPGRETGLEVALATDVASGTLDNHAVADRTADTEALSTPRQPITAEMPLHGLFQHDLRTDHFMTPAKWRLQDQQDKERRLQAAHKLVQEVQKQHESERNRTGGKRPLEEGGGMVPLRSRRLDHMAPQLSNGKLSAYDNGIEIYHDGEQSADTRYTQQPSADGLLTPRSSGNKWVFSLQDDSRSSNGRSGSIQNLLGPERNHNRVAPGGDDSVAEDLALEDSPTASRPKKRRLDADHSLLSALKPSLERGYAPSEVNGPPGAVFEEVSPQPPVRHAAAVEASMSTATVTGELATHTSGERNKEKRYILFEGVLLPRRPVMER